MNVTHGADYSNHELSPAELDAFTGYDIRFLIRYIGYPENPKCISHYPGAYQRHINAGRLVLLVIENGTTDAAGGHDGGVAMAERALEDAGSIGYPDSLPIFFCADGWLADLGIPVATAMSYLDGAASVMGTTRTGAYGFRDFLQAARDGGHAGWRWLAGTPPTNSEVAQELTHFYQWNGGTISINGMAAELDWAYPGVLDALHQNTPTVPPWPLAAGNYFGLITGPDVSHGGFYPLERPWVQLIQRALIRKGFVPGVTDPGSGWADGIYQEPTLQAVQRFQASAGHKQTGNIGPGDWALLLS